MFFNSVEKINTLRKKINRLLSIGMSNIYLKFIVEKIEVLKTSIF